MKYMWKCICGKIDISADVKFGDKIGEQCDSCSRVFDIWSNGKIKAMPLPASAGVKLHDVLDGTPIDIRKD